MDKKLFNKSSNFFKKEGFYVILFVCLCIVATVAAVTSRNNKLANKQNQQVTQKDTSKLANGPDTPIEDADFVKKPSTVGVVKSSDQAKTVSATTNMKDAKKPIAGTVVVKYTTAKDSILVSTSPSGDETHKTFFGVFIKPTNPDNDYVCAALDGVVEEVVKNEFDDGVKVTINHQNGYKTVYANLDKTLVSTVAKGKSIKVGDKIGKLGKSSGYSVLQEKYGKYLYFQVFKDGKSVDPQSLSAFKY